MMPEYQGGFWHFIRLPDGGGYMMPDGDRFHMVNGANWFDRTVSADACGIILTSLVINRQLWLYHDSGDAGLTRLYRMRDACRYDTEGYVTEHISQEEEAYAAARLAKIRRQNRIKAELQAVLDEQ
ncbi:hypothetical protein EIG74_20355 [Escherichia coli O10]|nr:hypothetical protein [Escherichia coli O10]